LDNLSYTSDEGKEVTNLDALVVNAVEDVLGSLNFNEQHCGAMALMWFAFSKQHQEKRTNKQTILTI
jgi:hypothetical protein